MKNESNSFKSSKVNKIDKELLKIHDFILKLKKKSNNEYSWENEKFNIFYRKTSLTKTDFHTFKFLLLQVDISKDDLNRYLILASGAKRERLNNPQYYSHLINNFPETIPNVHENQISIDLERTFPKDEFFQKSENINSLKNVLIAYSRRNKTLGYNQGLNFIAAKILKQLDNEENTFWLYTQILEIYLPLNYYNDLIGVMADCSIFQILLKKHHEDIYKVLEKNKLDNEVSGIYLKWFISLFTTSVSSVFNDIIFNYFILLGNKVLFLSGLAIFHILKNKILIITTIEDLYELFEMELPKINDEISKSILLYYILVKNIGMNLDQDRPKFQKKVMEEIYNQYLLREEIRISNKYNMSMSNSMLKSMTTSYGSKSQFRSMSYANQPGIIKEDKICNTYWSICIHDENNNNPPNLIDFSILRIGYNIEIIDSYFFDKCFKRDYIKSKTINYSLIAKGKYQDTFEVNFTRKTLGKDNDFKSNKSSKDIHSNLNDLSNREELLFKSYMQLLIERSIHICSERNNSQICVISKLKEAQNKKRMSIYNKKCKNKDTKLTNSAAKNIIACVTRTSLDNKLDKDIIVKDSNELFSNNIDLLNIKY